MSRAQLRLSDAIDQWLAFRKSNGMAPATIKGYREVLRRFLLVNGNLYVSSLGDQHVDQHMQVSSATRSVATLGIDYAALSQFFGWAVRKRQIGRLDNPMEGRSAPKPMPTERQRVPVGSFPHLLDSAEACCRRDRMVVALGLYLFLRGSEVVDLRVRDLLLDAGEISVRVWKTRQIDVMPVCTELDEELRGWLTYYSNEQGPLRPDWYLTPARVRGTATFNPETRRLEKGLIPLALQPQRPIVKIEDIPKRALSGIGFPIRDPDGKSLREGMHTLRRSGARALYDQRRADGYDGAMRNVQAMLHHKDISETEGYIGLTIDRVWRNESTKGQRMYGSREGVVSLADRREGVS